MRLLVSQNEFIGHFQDTTLQSPTEVRHNLPDQLVAQVAVASGTDT
jgi:hypothetical protein